MSRCGPARVQHEPDQVAPTRTQLGMHGTGESSRMGLWSLTQLPQTGVIICRMLALSCCVCLVLHTGAVSGVRHQIVASWIAFVGDSRDRFETRSKDYSWLLQG